MTPSNINAEYNIHNNNKNNLLTEITENIKKDPIVKLESYDAIIIETDRLLKREHTFFIINNIVTVALLITLFQVI
jgi:hypothetical protein